MTRQNGSTIRWFRIKAGKKPGEFASLANLSYSSLDNIENERRNASIEVIHRIADALGVPPAALVRDPAALLGKDAPAREAVTV